MYCTETFIRVSAAWMNNQSRRSVGTYFHSFFDSFDTETDSLRISHDASKHKSECCNLVCTARICCYGIYVEPLRVVSILQDLPMFLCALIADNILTPNIDSIRRINHYV